MIGLFGRLCVVLCTMLATVSCTEDLVPTNGGTGGSTGGSTGSNDGSDPDGLTEWIDKELCEKYLYNEEYATLSGRDYDLPYEEFFYGNLTSMKSNVFDYKRLPAEYGGTMSLFSYVEKTSSDSKTRVQMDSFTDFGFINLTPIYLDDLDAMGLYVLAVYDSSPAAEADLRRGRIITSVGGVKLTTSNYALYTSKLLQPEAGSTLALEYLENGETTRRKSITVAEYKPNPVLKCEVYGSDPDRKIGYLNYALFNRSFDNEMESAFETLHQGGVKELILDLRYNLGGFVDSASKMVSAITSVSVSGTQIFSYYRMNKALTADPVSTKRWTGFEFDEDHSLFYEMLSGVKSICHLSSLGNKVYCIVGYNTASASEMVVNSLRGMGYEVVLVGEVMTDPEKRRGKHNATRGKNVGMHVQEKTLDGNDYELAPITFENLNCKREGGYYDGIEFDYMVQFGGFDDFTEDEALVSATISLIESGDAVAYTRSGGVRRFETPEGSEQLMPQGAISGAIKEVVE